MLIDQELSEGSSGRDSILTVGVFDGVHLGHRHLIARLIEDAAAAGCRPGIVTFRNHPASVLRADFKPQYLTSLDERLSLLRALGADPVVPVTFDLELSKLSARDFVLRLQTYLRMVGLVFGPGFAIGRNREGDAATLASLGRELGFSVTVADLLEERGQPVRSTAVRRALAEGEVSRVAAMLGRNFELRGTVVKGVGRGRTLGFPTANLGVASGMAIPRDGIYATWAHQDGRRLMAATSIGTRPTFEESERTVEAFIMDFDEDLYDREIRLEFVRRLRDEEKYETVEALQEQVARDVDQTRAILRST